MNDSHKKEFWAMINVLMELMNRPPLTKEAIIVWWNILNTYEIQDVRIALDKWVDTETKPPTPSQIKELCKPSLKFNTALTKKPDREKGAENAKRLKDLVQSMVKNKRMQYGNDTR